MWVPVDDDHVLRWILNANTNPTGASGPAPARPARAEADGEAGGFPFLADTTDRLGRFRPVQRAENDYLIDREYQRDVRKYYDGMLTGLAH